MPSLDSASPRVADEAILAGLDSDAKDPPGTVHTPVVGSRRNPVCEEVELQGRQTVCSAACRRERSRRRAAERRQARDRNIAALLEAALRKLKEGVP